MKQNEYVNLGDVCRRRLEMQCQYGSRYASTICSHLRVKGDLGDYHSMTIHKDDVDEYVQMVLDHQLENGQISYDEFVRLMNL